MTACPLDTLQKACCTGMRMSPRPLATSCAGTHLLQAPARAVGLFVYCTVSEGGLQRTGCASMAFTYALQDAQRTST
jgi:hypothetical protein